MGVIGYMQIAALVSIFVVLMIRHRLVSPLLVGVCMTPAPVSRVIVLELAVIVEDKHLLLR